MANTEQVQEVLRNLAGATIGDKVNGVFPITVRSREFILRDDEVDDYIANRDSLSIEPETAIFIPGYYEHAVDVPRLSDLLELTRDEDGITLSNEDDGVTLQLSGMSTRFLLATLDKLDRRQMHEIRDRLMHLSRFVDRQAQHDADQPDLRDIFNRIISVKVIAGEGFRPRRNQKKMKSIAESGLFNISYARGVALNLSMSWERSNYRLGWQTDDAIQFPRRLYESDLLTYYQLALSNDSLILAYLALYNICEHFFETTSDEVLMKQLEEKIVSPTFNHRHPNHLRGLAALVRKFDGRTDEEQRLAHVIERYFTVDEIAEWVKKYEDTTEPYYTESQRILGQTVALDLTGTGYAKTLANRVYHIRSQLVENNRDTNSFSIPFSGHQEVLLKELPILLFLGEQLIIKSGSDF